MKVKFLGAAKTVTGSRYRVTQGSTTVVVDCGLFQGFKSLRLRNWAPFPVAVDAIDAVILTHAHLDHSGYLPLLSKNGYEGPVYATPATIALCQILLPDSGYLQEEEAKFANKRGYSKHKPALPLYTVEDAKHALRLLRPIEWKRPFVVAGKNGTKMEVELHPAGHLLGAASVVLRSQQQSVAFSGDLGRANDPLIRMPEPAFVANDLIVESTYGNRKHPDVDPMEQLAAIVERTYRRRGILLVPSFAVGRAQLLLYYFAKLKRLGRLPDIPIYLNSPMAAEANRAFCSHPEELKVSPDEMGECWKMVHVVGTPDESKALNERTEPAIILASSGMATGGRVLHHLKVVAPDPRNTILFVGFQAGGTRGEAMVNGVDRVKIHGEYWPIRAEVVSLETLSAHADADEVLSWIARLPKRPRHIYVTHGEPEAARVFASRVQDELGVTAIVPDHEQEIEVTFGQISHAQVQ
jgi:metallo-beta-lactamase family protein